MNKLLPWQQSQWQQLLRRQVADRLPHALLLTGPSGLGKRVFAEWFAQTMLCQSPTPQGPCDSCQSCHLFTVSSHPDCVRTEPDEAGKPIRVDQIRELSAFLGHTSQFGGSKIALIIPADAMNLNAANSLLKTLEEPPPNSLLLLISAAPARLPATVRSRCQTVVFKHPSAEQALAWLAPQVGSADPTLLLSLAQGAPLVARAYAEGERLARRQELFKSYDEVSVGKADPVRATEPWMKGDVAENLSWLIAWHTDMIRLKMTANPPRLLNPDLRAALQNLTDGLTPQTLFRRLDAAIRLHELCGTQLNPQLMIEAFFGDCAGEI